MLQIRRMAKIIQSHSSRKQHTFLVAKLCNFDESTVERWRMPCKNQLFAWHAPSFYGTFIEITELGNKEGVLLPAAMALDYFCHTSDLQHAVFAWDTELAELKQAAPAVREALIAGRCMPDYKKWK